MPIMKKCSYPTCFRERPCPLHAGQPHRDTKTAQERRFYGSAAWQRLRAAHRRSEPLCRECAAAGRVVKGTLVDHVRPIRAGGEPMAATNLQTLCNACHAAKRAREKQ